LLKMPHRELILSGDISSLIYHIAYHGVQNTGNAIRSLWLQLEHFVEHKTMKVIQDQWIEIMGTSIKLTLADLNPYSWFESHPDHEKTGGILGWWEKNQTQWWEVYSRTFELLKTIDRGIYDELNTMIDKIIPLGTSVNIHNSASYKECIGHLYMGYTLESDFPEINILEALIHESSHNKINLLMHFDPLILNDFSEKYYSPYRPDARHIHGCFLGLHAFVPTMYVCLKAYKNGLLWKNNHWLQKFVLYTLKNKICLRVIQKHAKLTHMWQEVVDEIQQVMEMTQLLMKQIWVSKQLLLQVNAQVKEHFYQVNQKYRELEY
jgi:HEXXH motif-containing protein